MKLQVGVKIIIKNDTGEWLLLRRANAIDHGGEEVWDIPGGRIETDESLDVALGREVAEETGLSLVDAPKLMAAQDIFVESKNLHVVRLTYVGTAKGDVTLSDEHNEFRWTKSDSLPDNLDPYIMRLDLS